MRVESPLVKSPPLRHDEIRNIDILYFLTQPLTQSVRGHPSSNPYVDEPGFSKGPVARNSKSGWWKKINSPLKLFPHVLPRLRRPRNYRDETVRRLVVPNETLRDFLFEVERPFYWRREAEKSRCILSLTTRTNLLCRRTVTLKSTTSKVTLFLDEDRDCPFWVRRSKS